MATNTSRSTNEGMSTVPCAMIYAGSEFILALPWRSGRFPIEITSTSEPVIAWSGADGQNECVALQGTTAPEDHENIISALNGDGLLVLEVSELSDIDLAKGHHHLVVAPARQAMKARPQ